jgi:hypothetical protein
MIAWTPTVFPLVALGDPNRICTARGSGPEFRSSMEFRSRAWRLTFGASSVDAWGAIAGIVKLCCLPGRAGGLPWFLERDELKLSRFGIHESGEV